MQIYLAASPQDQKRAAGCARKLAHAAYHIGQNSTLLRESSLADTSGGLLLIGDLDAPAIPDAEKLAQAVLRECRRRRSTGAVLDFESPSAPDRMAFVKALTRLFTPFHYALYVPEPYVVPGSIPLINTAISGGNFTEYLQNAVRQYSTAALDVQRLCMDFSLPEPSGVGNPMRPEQLTALLEQFNPQTFFSQDLCAKYFTHNNNGQTRFILYDDADTMRQKLQIGRTLGFRTALLMYPEVSDFPAAFWQSI